MTIKTILTTAFKSLAEMVFGGYSEYWGFKLPNTKYNYAKEVGDFLGSSVVMAPILWITRTFPEAPLALELEKELIHDHDMLELIQKPNAFYSGHTSSCVHAGQRLLSAEEVELFME